MCYNDIVKSRPEKSRRLLSCREAGAHPRPGPSFCQARRQAAP